MVTQVKPTHKQIKVGTTNEFIDSIAILQNDHRKRFKSRRLTTMNLQSANVAADARTGESLRTDASLAYFTMMGFSFPSSWSFTWVSPASNRYGAGKTNLNPFPWRERDSKSNNALSYPVGFQRNSQMSANRGRIGRIL